MSILAEAPAGGVVEELGGESRPLVLTQGAIERFEEQHKMGIYLMLDLVMQNAARSNHIRDIVALALVGGGMSDLQADTLIRSQPPQENIALRVVANNVLLAAFIAPDAEKKSVEDGSSSETQPPKATTAQAE